MSMICLKKVNKLSGPPLPHESFRVVFLSTTTFTKDAYTLAPIRGNAARDGKRERRWQESASHSL